MFNQPAPASVRVTPDCRNLFARHDVSGGAWLSNVASTNYLAVGPTRAAIRPPSCYWPTQVVAAKGCLATSSVSGHGVSIATAGVLAAFTVTVRDSFGNLRPTGSDFTLGASIVSDNLPPYTVAVNQPSANRFCESAAAGFCDTLSRPNARISLYSASYTVYASTVASRCA
jgi:hypothetical protein